MDKPAELMSDAELARALDEADAELALLETRRLRLVAAMDSSGYAERVGARDMVQYLEFRYRLDHSRAFRDVRLARALRKYPAVTAALPDVADVADDRDGEIPEVVLRPAQAEAIVTALEKVPTTVPVADLEFAEQELVRLARHLSPTDLRKAAEQSRDILDTDGPEPEEHKAAARESLTLTTADRGVKFKGYLANENAELFRTLIVTGARPHKTLDGQPDPRSREKRQADALTTTLTLAATALDAGTPSPTMPRPTAPANSPAADSPEAGSPQGGSPQAGSTEAGSARSADAGSAADTTADAAKGSAASSASGSVAGSHGGATAGQGSGTDGAVVAGRSAVGGDVVPGFGAKANLTVTIDFQDLKAATADAIGHTVYSNGLSAATIRRLACDANVIPIVLGSNSEPLDVGRRERLVTRAMRRALNTRDRGCVICNAPPVMCDAHHLISWIDGGHTKLDNLALVCRRHHTDLHHGHWTITITNGQVHVTRPTWADPPRHPHKPPADTPQAPKPPGDHPTPSRPPDDPSRAHEPPSEHPTPSGPSDDISRAQEPPDDAPRLPGPPREHRTPSGPSEAAFRAHEPPGDRPTPAGPLDDPSRAHKPTGDASRPPQPPREHPTPSEPSDGEPTPAGNSKPRISTPADDPWGETAAPAATASGVRPSRWHADESTRAEAARFAVWGVRAPNNSDTGPPSFATI
ncbi:uncharacterized protein DUF222 [Kribbella pratensis]|uniref:Uncharacterized protein DUF222 n=1 Tax=Kribbella pratensis TaxID=2512112 RepID=A0ABY2FGS9_9ACTN|nr:HNH endonuclease signature motif containing protein [Kribbella pratensis]TDW90571.1 uncharacterized protein DUF222 [Kribbella pratensis]